jgi:hypothetical protein
MKKNKSALLTKLERFNLLDNEVVLTLHDFFEGNDDYGSIGVNIYPDQPSPQTFYNTFKSLLAEKKANEILVRVADTGEPDDWFYTDTVYVIGTVTMEELKTSLSHLQFDEIYEEWMYGAPANAPEIQGENKVFSVWWD